MKPRMLLIGLLLAAFAGTAFAAGAAKRTGATPAPPPMTPQEMQDALTKAAAPGPNHEWLAGIEGQWVTTVKTMMDPAAEPEVTHGTCDNRMTFDGRYLVQSYTGTTLGMPFEGMGMTGYDNAEKRFVSTWVDNMGTGILVTRGVRDEARQTLVMTGEYTDALTGQPVHVRTVLHIVGPDQHTLAMYRAGPDGRERPVMEITYDRENAQKAAGQ